VPLAPTRACAASACATFLLALVSAISPGCGGGDTFEDLEPPPPAPFSISATAFTSVDLVTLPLPGATICLVPDGECTTSGADGSYTIASYPTAEEVGVLITKPGYLGVFLPFPPLPSDLGPSLIEDILNDPGLSTVFSDGDARLTIEFLGGTYPPNGGGYIVFGVLDQAANEPLAGVSVTSSVAAGEGPIYIDPFGGPDPSLDATSSAGLGALLNLPAGDTELTFRKPGYTCSIEGGFILGWIGTVDGIAATTLAHVPPDSFTHIEVGCCPNENITSQGSVCSETPVQ
jgi:hypothetical protein